jgi:putative MATE family efflux protein
MKAQQKKQHLFLEGSITKALLVLALPIVLTNLLQSAYQLTDSFWVGRLGAESVAAVSVSFPLIFLMTALGAGFSIAGSTLVAQYTGAKKQTQVDHISAQTIVMVVLTSITLGSLGFIFAPNILHLMGVGEDVFSHALGFLRVSFVGLVFIFGFAMFQSLMNAVGKTKIPIIIVGCTVLLNLILDPLFIFGFGPIPAYGVMGAAFATLGTQFLASLTGLIVLMKGKQGIHVRWHNFKPDLSFIKKAFRLGLPASIEQSARALGFTMMSFLVTSFGTLTMAAYGVGGNVLMTIIIPALGISIAIGILVGQNIGAGNKERAVEIARIGSLVAFGVLTVCGILSFIFAKPLTTFFVPGDIEVTTEAARFIRIMSLSFGFIGVQMAYNGVLRASGNMTAPMIMTLVSQWVIQFPLAYILSKHTSLGFTGIWYAFPISNIVMFVVTYIWIKNTPWQEKQLTKEEEQIIEASEEILITEGVKNK